jgi:hypothetical protein
MAALAVVNLGILLANLGVFGLTLKLYTEYFKDRSIGRRSEPGPVPKGGE